MINGMIKYSATIFYAGNGVVRAVTNMDDMTLPPEQNRYYSESKY